jgi:hypothetical protein
MADDLEVSHLHCPRPIRPRRLSPCRCQHVERAFAPDLLDVVAVYDNPLHWVSRHTNFLRFEDSMVEAGVRLTTVETAYGQMPFDLADRAGVRRVRLRANSICWRKENLARLGVAAIPDAQYLALVDGDMIFHDPLWVEEVLRGLQIHRVLQISSDIIWLGPRNELVGSGKSFMHWYLKSRRAHSKINIGIRLAQSRCSIGAIRAVPGVTAGKHLTRWGDFSTSAFWAPAIITWRWPISTSPICCSRTTTTRRDIALR